MTQLQFIEPDTKAECCATCRHWTLHSRYPHCHLLGIPLPSTLTACTCPSWKLELLAEELDLYVSLKRKIKEQSHG